MGKQSIKVFYSYCHKDEGLRDQLETHLAILSRRGVIESWHDRKIIAGQKWQPEIDSHIQTADLILLLISPDFIASEYCYSKELTLAIQRHENKECIVIPIILRPVDYQGTSFSRLQALPKDATPVTTWTNQDEAWLDVETGIKGAIENFIQTKNRVGADKGPSTIRQLLIQEVKQLETRYSKAANTACFGIPTGITDLDSLINGLQSAELVAVASRPSVGKTDFLINIAAKAVIEQNEPIGLFSLQMPAQQITRRLLAATSKIDSSRLQRALLTEGEFPTFVLAAAKIADAPLYIDESLELDCSELQNRAREMKKKHDIRAVLIDSLQQLSASTSGSNAECVRTLKRLAMELNIPIVITTNVSSDVDRRADKRPLLRDLESWRPLEEEADVILFLYREGLYTPYTMEKDIAEIIVAKNRNGPTGSSRAIYQPSISAFSSLIDQYPEEEKEEKN